MVHVLRCSDRQWRLSGGTIRTAHRGGRPCNAPRRMPAVLQSILRAHRARRADPVTPLLYRPHQEARRAVYDCLKKAVLRTRSRITTRATASWTRMATSILLVPPTATGSLDPTALAAADVQKYVGESRGRQRGIVILDCCFSGAVERVFRHGTAKGDTADQVGSRQSAGWKGRVSSSHTARTRYPDRRRRRTRIATARRPSTSSTASAAVRRMRVVRRCDQLLRRAAFVQQGDTVGRSAAAALSSPEGTTATG